MEGDASRYGKIFSSILQVLDSQQDDDTSSKITVDLQYVDQIEGGGGGGGGDPFAMMMGGGAPKEAKESKTKIDPSSLEEGQALEGKDGGEDEIFIQANLSFKVDPPMPEK
mmetsp:Transcript_20544/g.31269  ORF Transcript_20544/g.31269 Transcript_20544/m.31269 type:complete len:111 (+) Transcript_20544:1309-1641(+)